MIYYTCTPNFRRVYDAVGVDKMKKIMKMIEEIRYMCYLTTYFEQDCVPITDVSYAVNTDCRKVLHTILNQFSSNWNKSAFYWNVVFQLHTYIKERLYKVFCVQYPKFMAIHQCRFGDPKQALEGIVEDRNIEWNTFCNRKYYNELANPFVVERLLAHVFEEDENIARNVKYALTIYDLGDYAVSFLTKAEMESFIKHFVEVGAAFSIDAEGNWKELYTF